MNPDILEQPAQENGNTGTEHEEENLCLGPSGRDHEDEGDSDPKPAKTQGLSGVAGLNRAQV